MIRVATPADIGFLITLARARYTQKFDERAVREFLLRAMAEPSALVIRSDLGAAVATINRQFWGGEPEAYLYFIAAHLGRGLMADGIKLVRAVDTWRRGRGAVCLHFGEETGINLAPLARRLGAQTDAPSYVLRGAAIAAPQDAPAGAGSSLLDRVLLSPHLMGGAAPLRLVGE